MRRKSRDSLMRYSERYGEIEYSGTKVLKRWRGSGGNRNFPVTFAYVIY